MVFDQAMVNRALGDAEKVALKIEAVLGGKIEQSTIRELLQVVEDFADERASYAREVHFAFMLIKDARAATRSRGR